MGTTFHIKKASLSQSGLPEDADFVGQVVVDTDGPDGHVNLGGDNWQSLDAVATHAIDGATHNGVAGATENNLISFNADDLLQDSAAAAGDFQLVEQELEILAVSQATPPDVGVDEALCLWKDTDDSKVYLIFKVGTDEQQAVELE